MNKGCETGPTVNRPYPKNKERKVSHGFIQKSLLFIGVCKSRLIYFSFSVRDLKQPEVVTSRKRKIVTDCGLRAVFNNSCDIAG